jgi:glucose-6-phosphate isomerase
MEGVQYKDLDGTRGFARLRASARISLRKELSKPDLQRLSAYEIPAGGGLVYNYAVKAVDETTIEILHELSREQQLMEKYNALLNGEVMNTGENRMVLHHLTRGQVGNPVVVDGRDLGAFYRTEREKISEFAGKVHTGSITGSTGKDFKTVVQVGIGGSDLGPRALYLALSNYADTEGRRKMHARFISNVDPDDASGVLSCLDPETTLFVLVSKSGTTQETLTNEAFVLEFLGRCPGVIPKKHIVAVTSETSPLARSSEYLASFFIDDYIGGRYSSTSAVGGVVLSLAFGPDIFAELLSGAAEADTLAATHEPGKNAAALDALIGVYERNILGYPATAVLPYSQALSRFPAHLQQLDMESNGKSVNRFGEPVTYPTGPIVFGEPGTNGQHSFYQLLHQGTDIVPLQFIGFLKSQRKDDIEFEGSTSQKKLNANLAAQIVAFALGLDHENPNKRFAGERPSSLLYAERLTPRVLGALLAHFENKVMFQGFLWNINSFDQEGVQLGKVLTGKVLSAAGEMPESLSVLATRLGIL